MTPSEQIARAVLATFAGPYYVADTHTQRQRTLKDAAEFIAPLLAQAIADATRKVDINPT